MINKLVVICVQGLRKITDTSRRVSITGIRTGYLQYARHSRFHYRIGCDVRWLLDFTTLYRLLTSTLKSEHVWETSATQVIPKDSLFYPFPVFLSKTFHQCYRPFLVSSKLTSFLNLIPDSFDEGSICREAFTFREQRNCEHQYLEQIRTFIFVHIRPKTRSLYSSVSTVTRLRAGWPGLDTRQGTRFSIQWVEGALYRGVKRPGREADHSFQNAWSYTSTPSPVFKMRCLGTGCVFVA
jgi:hypothetical protein